MSSNIDPQWLEELRKNGWHCAGLAAAFAVFLWLVSIGYIPTDNHPAWIALPTLLFLVCSFLTLASLITCCIKPATLTFKRWRLTQANKKMVEKYIPYMTSQDKQILGYLLHYNQKMFDAEVDGGYATPLISKGIIRMSGRHGQQFDMTRVTFEIPDYTWEVLVKHHDQFPHKPIYEGDIEVYPWDIPWQIR